MTPEAHTIELGTDSAGVHWALEVVRTRYARKSDTPPEGGAAGEGGSAALHPHPPGVRRNEVGVGRRAVNRKEKGLRKLSDGRWQWSIKHEGRQIRRIADTKREAEEQLALARANVKAGRRPDYKETREKLSPTLAKATEEFITWSQKTKRPGTADLDGWAAGVWTRSRVLDGSWCMDEFGAEDLDRFKRELSDMKVVNRTGNKGQTLTKRSQDVVLERIKRLFALAQDWGWVKENPAKKLRLYRENNKRCRVLSSDEEDRLFAVATPFLVNFITFGLATGMRKGEILNLRWCDVDTRFGMATIQATRSKGRRDHHYPLNEQALAVLGAIPRSKDERALIFGNRRGTLNTNIERQWRRMMFKASVFDFHIHDLRHTFASRFLEAGGDLPTLREILGHRDFETTLRYAHIAPTRMKAAVELVSDPKAILRVQKGMSEVAQFPSKTAADSPLQENLTPKNEGVM